MNQFINTLDYFRFREYVFLEIRQYAHNANQQNLQEFTNFINIILNYLEEDDQVKLIAPISVSLSVIQIFSYALTEPHEIHLILMSLCLKYSNYKQARRFIETKQFQLNHKIERVAIRYIYQLLLLLWDCLYCILGI
ncbi:hypothetical protein pb186bvf_010965 [Paramecium bursaria]